MKTGQNTLKVDKASYDKVKAIADASGETLTNAANGVVSAGLGELKELGNKLNSVIKDSGTPISNEAVTIEEAPRSKGKAQTKAKAKAKADVKVAAVADSEELQFFCLECGKEVKDSEPVCSECGKELNWDSVEGADIEESVEESVGESVEESGDESVEESVEESDGGWILGAALLLGAWALRGRVGRSNLQSVRLPKALVRR